MSWQTTATSNTDINGSIQSAPQRAPSQANGTFGAFSDSDNAVYLCTVTRTDGTPANRNDDWEILVLPVNVDDSTGTPAVTIATHEPILRIPMSKAQSTKDFRLAILGRFVLVAAPTGPSDTLTATCTVRKTGT